MSGRGKGAKGLGKGGAKRHRKVGERPPPEPGNPEGLTVRQIAPRIAMELALTGDFYGTDWASRHGLIWRP